MSLPFDITFQDLVYRLVSPRHCPAAPTLRDVWSDLLLTLKSLVDAFVVQPTLSAFESVRFYDSFILASIGRTDLANKRLLKLSDNDTKEFRRNARRAERNLKADSVTDDSWSNFSADEPTLGDLIQWHKEANGIKRNGFRYREK